MQWEFLPEEVVKGEVDYSLESFRHDLREEVVSNLASDDEAFVQRSFNLIYDLCYWIATGREFADFAASLEEDSPLDVHVLQVIKEHMRDNIVMLGALLQRLIMDGMEKGMPLEAALERAAQHHERAVAASFSR